MIHDVTFAHSVMLFIDLFLVIFTIQNTQETTRITNEFRKIIHDVTFAHTIMLFGYLFGSFSLSKNTRNDKHYKVFRKSDSRCDFCTQCNAFWSLLGLFSQKMLIFCNPSNAFRMRFHWFAKHCFTNGIPMILESFSGKGRILISATHLMRLEVF